MGVFSRPEVWRPGASAEPENANANFRSCGRVSVPLDGHAKEIMRMSKSQPTIPSKIETTLLQGHREKFGFGAHALRWTPELQEVPGPGEYASQKTFHEQHGEKSCWGIRGTGGFASRSRRFGARSLPQLPTPGRGVPGPGAHEPLESLNRIRNPNDFNRCASTAIFHPESSRRPCGVPVPGPGAYETVDRPVFDVVKDPSAARAAFLSLSKRSDFTGGAAADPSPGPGAYHDINAASRPTEFQNYDSVFRQPSKKKVCRVHNDLPAASDRARERLGEFATEVAQECAGYNMMQPGPGAYSQNRDQLCDGLLTSKDGSSSFQPGSKRTEWAGADARLIPGPGRYQPESERKLPLPTHQSTFLSNVDRFKVSQEIAPGPSYYNPERLKTKNFHLNMAKQFVG